MPVKSPIPTLTPQQLDQIQAQIIKSTQPSPINLLLKHLSNSSAPQDALLVYNQTLSHPSCHDQTIFTYALKACTAAGAYKKGLEIHARVLKSGSSSNIFIQNSLLHFYVTGTNISSASQVFSSICFPDVVSWTTIVSGLSKCGFPREAIKMFRLMNVKPNARTLVSVISACSNLRDIRHGRAIHGYSLRNMRGNNVILDNAILEFHVKCGFLLGGKYLFETMPKRDVVSWTTMIGGFAQTGFCEEAFTVFQEMLKSDETEPNEATIANVLSACSSIGALGMGQWVHSYLATRQDLLVSDIVGNALINMYVKCGNVHLAVQALRMLRNKDTITWSTIISGLAMNGCGRQAIQIFSLMLVYGVHPDDVTFIGLLSACSNVGLVHQGLMFFKAMCNYYRIEPQMQHYACIVDMYGKAGLLEEAEALTKEMPAEAEGPLLAGLLNACKIHENNKILGTIRRGFHILDGRGVGTGTFALLSNAYASSDRWDDANKVREDFRRVGLNKPTGYSWVEVTQSNLRTK